MIFNARSVFALALLTMSAVLSVSAETIVAFSGSVCDGAAGNTVQCDGSCHQFTGRHSLKTSGSKTHCVTYFKNDHCDFTTAGQVAGTAILDPNVRRNVNTGTPVNSFICAPNNNCLLRS